MNYIDKEICRKILFSLRDANPDYGKIYTYFGDDIDNDLKKTINRHVKYLSCHGYIEEPELIDNRKWSFPLGTYKITTSGIDYLEDDGGITAEKNTYIIRFEQDDIVNLITKIIESSNMQRNEKESMMSKVKNLPSKCFEQFVYDSLKSIVESPMALSIVTKMLI